jgi:HSP20 family protein
MRALSAPQQNRSPAMWDPFAAFNEMRRHMDELMTAMLGQRSGQAGWRPSLEVDEDEQSFTVTMEVPGWAEHDVTVEVDRNILTIRGQRGGNGVRADHLPQDRQQTGQATREASHQDGAQADGGKQRQSGDRWSGSFIQSLSLPPTIDAERITARLERGLLTVHLPKQPQAQPRRIAISGARQDAREPSGG